MKKIKGWKTDGPMIDYFNVARSTISSWRSRNSIQLKYIDLFCQREGIPIQDLIDPQSGNYLGKTPTKPTGSVSESQKPYNSKLSVLFPTTTTFGDAVEKLKSIYESKNHILTSAILTSLSASEFSIKLIAELSEIKTRLSNIESILNEHKPPKNKAERRKAWIDIQQKL